MGFLQEASDATKRYRCTTGESSRGGFSAALWRGYRERGLAIIGEYKRCAPGRFIALHEPWRYAERLAPYIDAFSVLTEPFWFCGSYELIPVFSAHRPVLAKDFTACTEMVEKAASYGASAVLLILDQLGWRGLDTLYSEARSRGLEALIETSGWRDAVEVAHSFNSAIVGINARNLETLEISFERLLTEVREASQRLPSGTLLVAESSIDDVEKALAVREAGAHAILVGTWFMKNPNAAEMLAARLRGFG